MNAFTLSLCVFYATLTIARTRTNQQCPQHCRCVDQRYAVPATYCTQLGLMRVPRKISNTTEFLGLQENRITRVERSDFKKLTQLTKLKLDRNSISDLSGKSFKHLRRLKSLNLAHNQIRIVPAKLLENLYELEELFLNDNFVFEGSLVIKLSLRNSSSSSYRFSSNFAGTILI
jgi:hypothetical protein